MFYATNAQLLKAGPTIARLSNKVQSTLGWQSGHGKQNFWLYMYFQNANFFFKKFYLNSHEVLITLKYKTVLLFTK